MLRSSNSLILNRLFTHGVFQDLIKHGKNRVFSAVAAKYIENYQFKKNIDILDETYKLLSLEYRNEYFYKNTLLTKLLLHRHNLNTTVALTQIPIGKSKADFVVINGKATVYEIKSELDNYNRLETQLADYFKAFNHVCVVAPDSEFEKLYNLLKATPVGIFCLTKRNTLSKTKRKEPRICNCELNHRAIFRVLHKHEFETVITKYFGEIPVATQAQYYDVCLEKFSSIPVQEAYKLSLYAIKNRSRNMISRVQQIPYFLNAVLYFLNPSNKEFNALYTFLYKQFEGDA